MFDEGRMGESWFGKDAEGSRLGIMLGIFLTGLRKLT
jgi:hypothetical protein